MHPIIIALVTVGSIIALAIIGRRAVRDVGALRRGEVGGSSQDYRSFIVERAVFEAAVAAHRRAARAPREWALATCTVLTGFGVWLAGLLYDDLGFIAVSITVGWAILIGGTAITFRRHRDRVERYGLVCATCRQPLIDAVEWRGQLARADVVLATRRCPACGADCFAAET
jgi:hypothetical protein